MKTYHIINNIIVAITLCCLISCDYLDVVPTEQADIKDMMTNEQSTFKYLYGCYGYIQAMNDQKIFPLSYETIDCGGTDETVRPEVWQNPSSLYQWNSVSPSSGQSNGLWNYTYEAIGYCNQFIKDMNDYNPKIDEATKKNYLAEIKFLKAYYHFRALELFGPIPIVDTFIPEDTPTSQMPGRSHFDYCVDYIVNLLDSAADVLPAKYTNTDYYGRATSVIAKALKARVLLYAASPLWNGKFPYPNWRNTNYETPGYGKDLVNMTYSREKWVRAQKACHDALTYALANGFELFNADVAENLRTSHDIPLPEIPGIDSSTDEGKNFQKLVMMFRYLIVSGPSENNREILWGGYFSDANIAGSVPHHVIVTNDGSEMGIWSGVSPTLYTVEHFYTKRGIIPEEDDTFSPESDWFKSAGLSNTDIINLNVNREARFYAWISFDGDEYSPIIKNFSPLVMQLRNSQEQGYNPATNRRNFCVTGFLNKKYVNPYSYITNLGKDYWGGKHCDPLIRLAELYLDLAECDATLGGSYEAEAYECVNKIRERAGLPVLTAEIVSSSGKSLVDNILQERFVEYYLEGQRYHDIHRYLQGESRMNANSYYGLNALQIDPSFSLFNTQTRVNQSFQWNNRMYLLPVPVKDVYANPQMVQAPGY